MGKNGKKGIEVFRADGLVVDLPSLRIEVDVSVTAVTAGITSLVVRSLIAQVLRSLLTRIEK